MPGNVLKNWQFRQKSVKILISLLRKWCFHYNKTPTDRALSFCLTGSNLGLSTILAILQACKLDHKVAIKCTRNRPTHRLRNQPTRHIGSATNPPTRRQHNFFLVRRRQMSYDVARLSLMVPIDPCQILPLILVQQLSVRQKLRILKMG